MSCAVPRVAMQLQEGGMVGKDEVQQPVLPQQLNGTLRCAIRHQLLHLQLRPGLSHPAMQLSELVTASLQPDLRPGPSHLAMQLSK